MSYAIVRNEKLTRSKAKGICVHNDRKSKNHSNKEIDIERTKLNYYLKKNELNYVKEFDRLREKYNLKGQIRENSIIMCEMIFTSDSKFFDEIGTEETKRYFEESYNFICNYKGIGSKNIISAVVHLDEGTPHMHLVYIPVIKTTDKEGNPIEKVCSREFWKGRDSYRNLQNSYYEFISKKGFDLERGLPAEETCKKHVRLQDYKNLTNFEETKELLANITLDLPDVPDIKDLKKVIIKRDEKIENQIIKPKDELIQDLHKENVELHKQLSKQAKLVDTISNFEKNKDKIISEKNNLERKCSDLKIELMKKEKFWKFEYEQKVYEIESKTRKIINNLEKENNQLNKIIDKFKSTLKVFIRWICNKFGVQSDDELLRSFKRDTNMKFDLDKKQDTNLYKIRKDGLK